MSARPGLLQGTLDLLILEALRLGPMHGWGVAQRLGELSDGAIMVGQGSLYPALYRLEDRGLVRTTWSALSSGRRAKCYRLSAKGRRRVAAEEAKWRAFSASVDHVLAAARSAR